MSVVSVSDLQVSCQNGRGDGPRGRGCFVDERTGEDGGDRRARAAAARALTNLRDDGIWSPKPRGNIDGGRAISAVAIWLSME